MPAGNAKADAGAVIMRAFNSSQPGCACSTCIPGTGRRQQANAPCLCEGSRYLQPTLLRACLEVLRCIRCASAACRTGRSLSAAASDR